MDHTLYPIKITFYEVEDSDFTAITLSTPFTIYSNISEEEHDEYTLWPNQEIKKNMNQAGIDCLIDSLDLKTLKQVE
jgi:hypothetical protein